MGVHLRYGRASQVWACTSGMGVHLRYGRASQVWACTSGMGVHLRHRRASQLYRDSQYELWLAGPTARSRGRGTVAAARSISYPT